MNPKYAHLYDKDIPAEISVGLALHLDPDTLENEGGKYTCAPHLRVTDQHFFVCVSVNGDLSRWVPLYTEAGLGRTEITTAEKQGHPKWAAGSGYWHKDQIWEASSNAVYLAAGRAHDKSRKGSRNTVKAASVPNV